MVRVFIGSYERSHQDESYASDRLSLSCPSQILSMFEIGSKMANFFRVCLRYF